MRTKLFSNTGYGAKLHKHALKSYYTFVEQFAYFGTRPRKVLFFRAPYEQRSLQKALLVVFFFEQLLSKFLRDYGKLFRNLEQLVESPKYGAFFKVKFTYSLKD